MRFDAFEGEAPLDVRPCAFPWKPAVTFHIHRLGRREYAAGNATKGMRGVMRALRLVAKSKGLTMKQLREMNGADLQAELEQLDVDYALGELGDSEALMAPPPDPERVARYLVESVDGPLLFTDEDEPLGWHDSDSEAEHAGAYFLAHSPEEFTNWIIAEATSIELEFQSFMDAAAKNSRASSVPVAEGEGVAH